MTDMIDARRDSWQKWFITDVIHDRRDSWQTWFMTDVIHDRRDSWQTWFMTDGIYDIRDSWQTWFLTDVIHDDRHDSWQTWFMTATLTDSTTSSTRKIVFSLVKMLFNLHFTFLKHNWYVTAFGNSTSKYAKSSFLFNINIIINIVFYCGTKI